LSAGCALGWTSNLQYKILYTDYNFPVNDIHFSLLGSMLNFGAAIICIIAGLLINVIGRKITMLVIVIPFTIGWALLVSAVNPAMLILGRTLIGIGCGSVCVACPVSKI
jgi:SP family facilitated glucose transporter-like MFS transporter 8